MSKQDDLPAPRILPKKEAELFRSVVKFYETKQYKKGIKAADTILKKIPNHGETQSMRALLLHMLGQDVEAYEFIKKGIRNDLRSHICWHAYGLMHRTDQNYKEAAKCFLNALKIEPDNQSILRDLSWLQIQIRDLDGFVETRRKLLHLKATIRQSWVAYAVANYTAGHYETAFEVIQKYNETVSDKEGDYAESELLMFQNLCIERQEAYERALMHLQANKDVIVDKLAIRIKSAELLTLQGRFDESKHLWNDLVTDQPDNYRLISGLQTAYLKLDPKVCIEMFQLKHLDLPSSVLELNAEQKKLLLEIHRLPRFKSRSSTKIILSLLEGPEFEEAIDSFLQKNLRSAIPSLYSDVCALIRTNDDDSNRSSRKVAITEPFHFRNHPKTKIILKLLDSYIENLKSIGKFSTSADGDSKEAPTSLLWSLFLKANLVEKSGNLVDALQLIEECLVHTPTALDMHIKKGHLLKKLGDYTSASEIVEVCRSLDLQDRYLNNIATKRFLQADNIDKAIETISMFTKHDGDPQYSLYELQCSWYEIELAESFTRQKKYGLALKNFYAIKKHFNTYFEDQFDFHGYCMRKTTLRAYLDALNVNDTLYSHIFFQRAFRGVVTVYLSLLDAPNEESSQLDEIDLSKLSPEERKKEKARLRKLKKKETSTEDDKTKQLPEEDGKEKKKNAKAGEVKPIVAPKDDDPKGEKLLNLNPLDECTKWCLMILKLPSCDVQSHILILDVMIRKKKFFIGIRSLVQGFKKDPFNASLSYLLVKFAHVFLEDFKDKLNDLSVVNNIVKSELFKLLKNSFDLQKYVDEFIENSKSLSLSHRVAAAKSLLFLYNTPEAKVKALNLFTEESIWNGTGISLEHLIEAYLLIKDHLKNENAASTFKTRILSLYPYARYFGGFYKIENLDELINSKNEKIGEIPIAE